MPSAEASAFIICPRLVHQVVSVRLNGRVCFTGLSFSLGCGVTPYVDNLLS